jgi:HD-GYP domain-containing protein (c-di-GMP phosphodiesterase class II)
MSHAGEQPRDLTTQEILDLLFSYVPKIAAEKKLDNLLILMADLGRTLVVADRCSLWLLDEASGELWTKVAHGVDELRMPLGAGFVGYSVESGEPLCIDDAYADPRFNAEMDKQTRYHTRSIMTIPVKNNDGKVMGVFQAVNKKTAAAVFSRQDLERLSLTATYSGKSLESAMLYQEIENTQREILFIMGEVGESRSKETGNHVKRVAEYCHLMSTLLGLPEDEAELIKLASPMHDIGKIAIPDSVLKKPGKLDDDEYRVMKTHAVIGYDMLKNSPRRLLRAAAEIAWFHHEKWDGTGYPQGLAGEQIPLFGRICAVADVFDALANDRCYKKAWPREKIVDLFATEGGKHFDPRLAALLLQNYDRFEAINREFMDEYPQ